MRKILLCLILLIALSGMAAAQLVLPTQILIGGTNQDKSNINKYDYYAFGSTSFSILNNGNKTVNNIVFSSTLTPSTYNASFVPSTISSLAPGASATVTIKAIVPGELSTFYQNRNNPETDRSLNIGNVNVNSGDGQSFSIPAIFMQTTNKLIIKKVLVQVNDGSQKTYHNGDEVKDLKPGDKLTVEVDVEDKYTSTQNVDFSNVQTDISAIDTDFDAIDQTLDSYNDVRAGKTKTDKYSFTVDTGISDGTYSVGFTLTGDDDYGSTQGEFWKIDFSVSRSDQDIEVKSATLSQDTLQCTRDTSITTRLENDGNDDTSEAVLQVSNDQLGITQKVIGITLNSGDAIIKSLPISVPSDAKAGTYSLEVTTYWDYSDFSNQVINNVQLVDLKVADCIQPITCWKCVNGVPVSETIQQLSCPADETQTIPNCPAPTQTTTTTPKENVTVVVTPPTQQTTTTTTTTPVPVTYRQSTSADMTTILILVAAVIVVILIMVLLIVLLVRKK